MPDLFFPIMFNAMEVQTFEALQACNLFTAQYGLCLSAEQIQSMVNKRFDTLKAMGRMEFGEGILKQLIYQFCDSPYITQENYEGILCDLLDSFYYFKNESMDSIPDDVLLSMMKRQFDGKCQGSTEFLNGSFLEELCRSARYRNSKNG